MVPEELSRRYLTAELPPIEGVVRAEPEDFVVDEVPLYAPSGEGEHRYLWVEKRGIPTHEAVRRLSKVLRVKPRAIGTAGLKDAHAVTRQWISAHTADDEVPEFEGDSLRILETTRHGNKLKTGHLLGNRFTLRLRGSGAHVDTVRAGLEVLGRRGVPNYFGLQRFGNDRHTHRLGEALVREDAERFLDLLLYGADGPEGEDDPSELMHRAREALREGDFKEAARRIPRRLTAELYAVKTLARGKDAQAATRSVPTDMRRFYVSAYQSWLFNTYLDRRLDTLDTLHEGEIASLHRNGAAFTVTDLEADRPRLETFEISPSGPLFGRKLLRPAEGSAPREAEDALLAELAPGLTASLTAALGAKPQGLRRPLRFPLTEASVEVEGEDLVVRFQLPKGCYATSVLEELFKRSVD